MLLTQCNPGDHESHESFYSWEFLERHTDQKRQETMFVPSFYSAIYIG